MAKRGSRSSSLAEQFQRIEEIFHQAASLAGDQLPAFLDRACADDPELRAQLEALLAQDDPDQSLAELRRRVEVAMAEAAEAESLVEAVPTDASVVETMPEAATPPEPSSSRAPPASIPGYQILSELHRGGQGVVYRAIQKSTKRKVAIKVMHEGPFAGPAEKARFEREVQILGQLKHPNIVTIYDSGSASGSFYFVMDYISGQSLDVYMAAGEHSIDETLKLFATICEAMNAAHLRGVIHRDLKPGNIRIDDEGRPHILDFGLAKVAIGDAECHAMTMTGQFIGSLPWSSPEQAEAKPGKIDIRTDVYSLGVILYQMLTGKFPYDVIGNMRDVLDRIMKAEPARPSKIRKQINDEVETIVLKCLSKQRERRYQTAGVLAEDIKRYLASEPIEAKRDSGWYVLRKTLRRYRWQAGAVGALATMLVILAVSMTIQSARLRHERDKLLDLTRDYGSLARFTGEFGDNVDSNAMFSDLARQCERQILLNPNVVDWHYYLYTAHDQLFRYDRARGDLGSAELHCDIVMRETQRLVSLEPENPKWQRAMAIAFKRRGQLHYSKEQYQKAYDAFTVESELRETIRGDAPADPVVRKSRASMFDWLAKCCRKLGGRDEEEKRHRLAALEILRDLSTADPDNYEFAIGRTQAANNLAAWHIRLKTPAADRAAALLLDEAFEAVETAQRILRRPEFQSTQNLSDAIEVNRAIIGIESGAEEP